MEVEEPRTSKENEKEKNDAEPGIQQGRKAVYKREYLQGSVHSKRRGRRRWKRKKEEGIPEKLRQKGNKLAKLRRHASRVHFGKPKEEKVDKNFDIQVVSGTHI